MDGEGVSTDSVMRTKPSGDHIGVEETTETVRGFVLSQGGQGLAGRVVRCLAQGDVIETQSQWNGAFQLSNVPVGGPLKVGLVDKFIGLVDDIDLSEASRASVITIIESTRGLLVSGRIVDEGGIPLSGAEVVCGAEVVSSREDGAYELAARGGVGGVAFRVAARGFVSRRIHLYASGDIRGYDVVMSRAVELRGVIVDEAGLPVEATVDCGPSGAGVRTDQSGQFRLWVAGGEALILSVRADGFESASYRCDTNASPLTLILKRSVKLVITVTTERGSLVDGAAVFVAPRMATFLRPVAVTVNGRCEVLSRPGGVRYVYASTNWGESEEKVVSIDGPLELVLTIRTSNVRRGRVVFDRTGFPIANAFVVPMPGPTSQRPGVVVGPTGEFSCLAPPAGKFEVEVIAPGCARKQAEMVQDVDNVIRLSAEGVMKLGISTPAGAPRFCRAKILGAGAPADWREFVLGPGGELVWRGLGRDVGAVMDVELQASTWVGRFGEVRLVDEHAVPQGVSLR